MATKKKLLEAAAGSAGGGGAGGLNVEEVFSTYLFSANGGTQTITNGIDLAGEGGAVWLKARTQTYSHTIHDTERGVNASIFPNLSNAETTGTGRLTAFNSDGFEVGSSENSNFNVPTDSVSWTFRKAPKFFDVVTYTGTGSPQTIAHNLGTTVGSMIIKQTNGTRSWAIYHRSVGATAYFFEFGTSIPDTGITPFNNTEPTSSEFTVGTNIRTNDSGATYVAYLFAHNDGDGEFGPDADADIIKCGSYTGSASAVTVNLGFEPQWVMIKNTTLSNANSNWIMIDSMRGHGSSFTTTNSQTLKANSSDEEKTQGRVNFTADGLYVDAYGDSVNSSGSTYIYIAIRRGPMAVPTDATEVFHIENGTNTTNWTYDAGFPVDFTLYKIRSGGDSLSFNRLTGSKYLSLNSTAAESSYTAGFDNMSFVDLSPASNNGVIIWDWKRAPSFFDAVAYTGDGVAGRTVSHNLTVPPEMIWVKRRDTTYNWPVYLSPVGATHRCFLNLTNAATADSTYWNNTEPTSTEFTLGTYAGLNASGGSYIAYLFASLAGISKVGSYTGTGSQIDIDCGFTAGARFVLVKKTSSTSNWNLFDAERGIVSSANDPRLELDTTDAEATTTDFLEPYSGGFTIIAGSHSLNNSGASYVYYAIA